MTSIELERYSVPCQHQRKMYLQFLHFFIIAYDANAPGPCIEMLHASAYKPLTGAINSPEDLLYPLPAFVFTTSNINVWCLLGLTSPELMYA
jgi:hypothetical protein